MKFEIVRIGMKIKSKIDGGFYRIIDVTKDAAVAARLVADELGNEVIDECSPRITIPKESFIAVSFIEDTAPYDDPDLGEYSVDDGILLKNGEPAIKAGQGDIYIKEILAVNAGNLILAVRPRGEGDNDLFAYNPVRDKFDKIIRATLPTLSVIKENENGILLLGYSASHTVEKTDAEGKPVLDGNGVPEVYEIFDGASVIMVSGGKVKGSVLLPTLYDMKSVKFVEETGTTGVFVTADKAVTEDGVLLPCDKTVMYAGFYTESGITKAGGTVEVADVDVDIRPAVTFTGSYPAFSVNDGSKITVMTGYNTEPVVKSPLCDKVRGMQLVDITEKDHVKRISFCDESLSKIKTIVVTETRDRGNVITIEG